MAQTPANIVVTEDEWVDINTVSGIAVGTRFQLSNTGNAEVKLVEDSVQPALNDTRGIVLTPVEYPYATVEITSGALRVWAKSLSSIKGTMVAQELS